MTGLYIWRDSVSGSEDVDAPHEIFLHVRNDTLCSIANRLLKMHYLAHVAGGCATWVLQSGGSSGRPLAVLAQQWPEPHFPVEPATAISTLLRPELKPHLYIKYLGQLDPQRVFDSLLQGEEPPNS